MPLRRRLDAWLSMWFIAAAGAITAVAPSCSSDVEQPDGATATVASSSSGIGGAGGGGGRGGTQVMVSSSTGCMVSIGGCYDTQECTAWAACECPDLACDADCVAYRMCAAACTDLACVDTCQMQHTEGAAQEAAILKCAHCGADPCFGSLCNGALPAITCP